MSSVLMVFIFALQSMVKVLFGLIPFLLQYLKWPLEEMFATRLPL